MLFSKKDFKRIKSGVTSPISTGSIDESYKWTGAKLCAHSPKKLEKTTLARIINTPSLTIFFETFLILLNNIPERKAKKGAINKIIRIGSILKTTFIPSINPNPKIE